MIQKCKDIFKLILGIENSDLLLLEKLGIPLNETRRLKRKKESHRSSVLFGKQLEITSDFWHMHSLKEIFLEDVYKFNTTSPAPYIIDCGANIGLSVIYFKKLYPHSHIIAFEPDPDIYKKLEGNLAQFNLSNVITCNKAVWKENTLLKFNAKGNLGGTIETEPSSSTNGSSVVTDITATRLKPYLERKVDFLKMDIEGAEFEVLNDCSENMKNVANIFVEYHSSPTKKQDLAALLQILEKADFRIYIKEAWNNLPHPYLHNNSKPFWDLQLNIFGYRV